MNGGAQLEVGTDASPMGLGGWLAVNGKIAKFFSSPLTDEDARLYGHELGSCVGQQTWECLAILVALRLWHEHYANRRVTLKVRGDNVGALTLVVKMRPANAQQAIIAREIALLVARAAFPPAVTHTPGIAHKVADLLSRKMEPCTSRADIHPALSQAVESVVPVRHGNWYRALDDHV